MSRPKQTFATNGHATKHGSFHQSKRSKNPQLGNGPLKLVHSYSDPQEDYVYQSVHQNKHQPSHAYEYPEPADSPSSNLNQRYQEDLPSEPPRYSHAYSNKDTNDIQAIKRQLNEQMHEEIESAISTVSSKFEKLINELGRSQPEPQPPHRQSAHSYSDQYYQESPANRSQSNSHAPRDPHPQWSSSTKMDKPSSHHQSRPMQRPQPEQQSYTSAYQEESTPKSLMHQPSMPVSNPKVTSSVESALPSPQANTEISSKLTFLEKELSSAYKREQRLEEELNKIKEQLTSEKVGVNQQLEDLEKKVEGSSAPEDSKFFSLSSELSEVVKAMNNLVDDHNSSGAKTPESEPATGESVEKPADKTTETKDESKAKAETKKDDKKEAKSEDTDKKAPNKKKKMIIIAVTAIILLGGIGFAITKFMGGSTSVDPELMQEYLPSDAQTEDNTEADNAESADAEPQPEVQGASISLEDRRDAAQSNISYSETRWETHKDPKFGVIFDYPINVTDIVRTDMSITVLRKTGYIFKVQRIDTAQELDDYWKQIKARSLRYKVQPTTLRDYEALYLELEDITEYPGDRYLVKRDDMIYDIWYATASKNLNDDDAKRVDIMLNSLDFIEISV